MKENYGEQEPVFPGAGINKKSIVYLVSGTIREDRRRDIGCHEHTHGHGKIAGAGKKTGVHKPLGK